MHFPLGRAWLAALVVGCTQGDLSSQSGRVEPRPPPTVTVTDVNVGPTPDAEHEHVTDLNVGPAPDALPDSGPDAETCDAVDEVCDGNDNDCDGLVDESLVRPCGEVVDGCRPRIETCTAGVFGECTEARIEICDGADNDCDGVIDEGVTQACGSDIGECVSGTQTCVDGAFGACVGSVGPGQEGCDGLDNDCDGSVDEGLVRACGSDVGRCEEGTETCDGGNWGACDGETMPGDESCNGEDDDCDGETDEGLVRACGNNAGGCRPGSETCVDGVWGDCVGGGEPIAEACNNIDDDCDGTTDEELVRACGSGVGACGTGTETCNGGDWGDCQGEVGPDVEVCNGVDDDCDGTTDEDLLRACGSGVGACRQGTETCNGGDWGDCQGEVGPDVEVCNGVDDDCDGSTDEDVCDPGEVRDNLVLLGALANWPGQDDNFFDAAAVSPDGTRIAAAYKDTGDPRQGRLGLWNTSNRQRLWISVVWVWSEGCDFHPSGDTIFCAHTPRPDTSVFELLTFDAQNGALLRREQVNMGNRPAQDETWWGDSARASADGNWVAGAVNGTEGGYVLVFSVDGSGRAIFASRIDGLSSCDEVVFSLDSRAIYASDFVGQRVWRVSYDGQSWAASGSRNVGAEAAGIDVDGGGRIILAGFRNGEVLIVTPRANFGASPIARIGVNGTSYEVCADPRGGAQWGWAVSQEGGAQALDMAAGASIGFGQVAPVDDNGIAMSCVRSTGQPFIVSRGNLWTWTE